MPQTPASSPKLVLPLLAAALLGGGVAAGVTAVATDGGGGTTTTVVRQAPVADQGGRQVNASDGLTAADIYKKYAPGVVYISAEITSPVQSPFDFFGQQQQKSTATGSGFVIDKAGDILTNNHVIDGASKVTVQFADHKTVAAKVVGKDPSTDLALLKVDPSQVELDPLPLGSSNDVHVGDPTIAIGNPFGLDRTLTTGVVSALQRKIPAPDGSAQITNVIQTDAAINPGNSGGPLIDATGHVIGINSQIETGGGGGQGNVGIGFAVPIDTAKSLLPSLKKGTVERAYIGVSTLSVDRSLDALDLPVSKGALVQSVEAGSPAEKAGLRGGDLTATLDGQQITIGGDVITKFDGKTVTSADQLTQLVTAKRPGDQVKLEIVRKKQSKTLTLTLGKKPTAPTVVSPG